MAARREQGVVTPGEIFTIVFWNARENDRREAALALEAAPEEQRPADRPAVELRDSLHLDALVSLRAGRKLRRGRERLGEARRGHPAGSGLAGGLRIARRGK